jgi:kinesin family protein 3/17
MVENESVRVVVRSRPLSDKEIKEGHSNIVAIDREAASITIQGQNVPPKTFTFDSAFDNKTSQLDIYNRIARPIVDSALNGYNGTIFAYGQTGTGKVLETCIFTIRLFQWKECLTNQN